MAQVQDLPTSKYVCWHHSPWRNDNRYFLYIEPDFEQNVKKPVCLVRNLYKYIQQKNTNGIFKIKKYINYEDREESILIDENDNGNVDVELFNNWITEYFTSETFIDTQKSSPLSLIKIIKEEMYNPRFSAKAFVYWFGNNNVGINEFDKTYERVKDIFDRNS